ncbi:MAG TPA: TolC family protein, partial [Polyangiaceae bacterium]
MRRLPWFPAVLGALAIVSVAGRVRAEAAAPTGAVLTLPQALALAHEHLPTLRASAARIEAARVDAAVPRAEWMPRVTAGLQFAVGTVNPTSASTFGVDGVDIPRIAGRSPMRSPDWNPYPSTFVGLGAHQELFDFGRIAAATAALDAQVRVESERARTLMLDVDLAVEEAYFAVLAAKNVARAARDARDRAKADREYAEAGVRSGLRPPVELARAVAEEARFEAGVARADGGVQQARAVLAAVVGQPDADLDTAEGTNPTADPADLGASIERALAQSPRLRQLLAELQTRELETKAIAAESRPNIFLDAVVFAWAGGAKPDGGPEAFGNGWAPTVPNYSAGLTLNIPLWDAGTDARARASKAREAEQRFLLEDVRQGV